MTTTLMTLDDARIIAPHEVRDEAKLASLVEVYRQGDQLPPIVAVGGNLWGARAITGSHRIAAYKQAEFEGLKPVLVVVLVDEETADDVAREEWGLDDDDILDASVIWEAGNHELNDYCEAMLAYADRNGLVDLAAALVDQVA